MKLEVGKFYFNKHGRCIGPMRQIYKGQYFGWTDKYGYERWSELGSFAGDALIFGYMDLVREAKRLPRLLTWLGHYTK